MLARASSITGEALCLHLRLQLPSGLTVGGECVTGVEQTVASCSIGFQYKQTSTCRRKGQACVDTKSEQGPAVPREEDACGGLGHWRV